MPTKWSRKFSPLRLHSTWLLLSIAFSSACAGLLFISCTWSGVGSDCTRASLGIESWFMLALAIIDILALLRQTRNGEICVPLFEAATLYLFHVISVFVLVCSLPLDALARSIAQTNDNGQKNSISIQLIVHGAMYESQAQFTYISSK